MATIRSRLRLKARIEGCIIAWAESRLARGCMERPTAVVQKTRHMPSGRSQ